MKKIVPALFLMTLVILLAPPAMAYEMAQQDCIPDDGCGSVDPNKACYASSGGSLFCSDEWGCPVCGLDMQNRAICARFKGQNGKCYCKPKTVTRDQYGLIPICEQSGSCVQNRQ